MKKLVISHVLGVLLLVAISVGNALLLNWLLPDWGLTIATFVNVGFGILLGQYFGRKYRLEDWSG